MKRISEKDVARATEPQLFNLLYSDLLRLRNRHETGWNLREQERALDRCLLYTRELRSRGHQMPLFTGTPHRVT